MGSPPAGERRPPRPRRCFWQAWLCFGLALAPACLYAFLRPTERGPLARACEVTALFSEGAANYATFENFEAFVATCAALLQADEELRRLLLPPVKEGSLLRKLRAGVRVYNQNKTFTNFPNTTYEECATDRHKRVDELVFDRQRYLQAGIFPLQEQTIPVSEISKAIAQGRTARFDATKVLPRRLFNISVPDLLRLHPELGSGLEVRMGQGMKDPSLHLCWKWLTYLTGTQRKFQQWGPWSLRTRFAMKVIIPLLLRFSCPHRGPTVAQVAALSDKVSNDPIPWSLFGDADPLARKTMEAIRKRPSRNFTFPTFNLNTRQVPKLLDGVDIAEQLGLGRGYGGDAVEHTHSVLWMGTTKGGIHSDWQDNVLMQLTGSAQVLVVPANCTGMHRIPKFANIRQFLTAGMPANKSRLPFYHMTLAAGEGVVIPSMAQHRVLSMTSNRVGLNAFWEPRLGKMQWPSAPGNFFRIQDPLVAAFRVLYLRTLRHLWDERRIVYCIHTERLEYV